MNRVEDIIAASKLNDILKKKDDNDKTKNTVLWVLAIVGAVAAIAGIAYAVSVSYTHLDVYKRQMEVHDY